MIIDRNLFLIQRGAVSELSGQLATVCLLIAAGPLPTAAAAQQGPHAVYEGCEAKLPSIFPKSSTL